MTIQIDQMIQPMTAILKGNPNLPSAFVDEFARRMRERLLNGQVEEVAIQAYAKYFTAAEIRQMIDFQESPVGRKMRQVNPQMLAEVSGKMQELGGRMGREIAAEIIQDHPEYANRGSGGAAAGGAIGGMIGAVPNSPPPPPPPRQNFTGQKVDQETQSAKLIKKVDAVYPPLAKSARVQGKVRFTALIGTDGKVESVQLVSGHPLLIQAAKEAVMQWEYEPTVINGKPVEVITDVVVDFHLDVNQ